MPRDQRSGAFCFCPVCHSVLLSETLTLLITFEQWALELWYFTRVSFRWVPFFLPCDLDLGVWPIFGKLTLLITFEQWVLRLWYFTWVSLVIRPFLGFHYFLPCDLDLRVWHLLFKNFNVAKNFWIVSARALIFHMNIPSVGTINFYYQMRTVTPINTLFQHPTYTKKTGLL